MSPIMLRPVREQLEHDRVIRQLTTKLKRKFDVSPNVGTEQVAAVKAGANSLYPDLVLTSPERGKKLQGIVEVETGESVNHLEAMAQWAPLGRLRVPFYLYIPVGAVDQTRRLCLDNQVAVSEIWSYLPVGDQIRFAMVYRAPVTSGATRRATAARQPKTAGRRSRPGTSTRRARPSAEREARRAKPTRRVRLTRRPEAARRPKPTPRGKVTPRAKVPRARVPRAKVPRAKVTRAKVQRAKATRAKVPRAKVIRAKVQRAKVTRAKVPRAQVTRANTAPRVKSKRGVRSASTSRAAASRKTSRPQRRK